jgi:RNA polymerase sigma-70 factor, ECF subfamily
VIGAEFAAVLAAAQGGDEEAYARLFHDIQPVLLRYLNVIAGQAAEDVAGQMWLEVVAGLDGFRGGEESWRAWLFMIARHRAADAGRRRDRRRVAEGGIREGLTAPDTADVAVERASTRATLALISSLPRDQAEIIMLRVVAGLDASSVARIVGKRPGTVRVAAHRAMRQLATMIDRAGVL